MYEKIYIYTHTQTYIHTYIHTHIHTLYIHVHTHTYLHTYIHTYTYIHLHVDALLVNPVGYCYPPQKLTNKEPKHVAQRINNLHLVITYSLVPKNDPNIGQNTSALCK